MRIVKLLAATGVGLFSAVFASSATAALFQLTELHVPGAITATAADINDRGQVVGSATAADGTHFAFISSGKAATIMETWEGSVVTPVAVNNAGNVAGYALKAGEGLHALVWRGESWVDLGRGLAQGINSSGDVVGYHSSALLWQQSTTTVLGPDIASAINDANVVVGYRYSAGQPVAVLWRDGRAQDLERAAAAYNVNERGDIVGESGKPNGQYQATMWTANGKVLLGALGDGEHTTAFDINEAGDVVGYGNSGALMWASGKQIDLNSVLMNPSGGLVHLSMAIGINETGQVAATGNDENNFMQVYVLTPVPEPSTWSVMFAGLSLIGLARRRQSLEGRS